MYHSQLYHSNGRIPASRPKAQDSAPAAQRILPGDPGVASPAASEAGIKAMKKGMSWWRVSCYYVDVPPQRWHLVNRLHLLTRYSRLFQAQTEAVAKTDKDHKDPRRMNVIIYIQYIFKKYIYIYGCNNDTSFYLQIIDSNSKLRTSSMLTKAMKKAGVEDRWWCQPPRPHDHSMTM